MGDTDVREQWTLPLIRLVSNECRWALPKRLSNSPLVQKHTDSRPKTLSKFAPPNRPKVRATRVRCQKPRVTNQPASPPPKNPPRPSATARSHIRQRAGPSSGPVCAETPPSFWPPTMVYIKAPSAAEGVIREPPIPVERSTFFLSQTRIDLARRRSGAENLMLPSLCAPAPLRAISNSAQPGAIFLQASRRPGSVVRVLPNDQRPKPNTLRNSAIRPPNSALDTPPLNLSPSARTCPLPEKTQSDEKRPQKRHGEERQLPPSLRTVLEHPPWCGREDYPPVAVTSSCSLPRPFPTPRGRPFEGCRPSRSTSSAFCLLSAWPRACFLRRDVAAVALGGDVLAHRLDRFAGDDPRADRRLQRRPRTCGGGSLP